MSFTLNGLSGTITYSPPGYVKIGGQTLYIFWRMETPPNTTPSDSGENPTFTWIRGSYADTTAANSTGFGSLINDGSLKWSLNASYSLLSSNVFPLIIPQLSIYSTVYVYCRIGLPMNVACSFTSVTMTIS